MAGPCSSTTWEVRAEKMKKQPTAITVPKGFEYLDRSLSEFEASFSHTSRNVFVMMPYSVAGSEQLFNAAQKEVEAHGLIALRADMKTFSQVLWWNVVTYMLGSSYGICIYEPNALCPFNPNISIEAGFMLALDKPVLFLVNSDTSRLPTDFSGHIYKEYRGAPSWRGRSIKAAVRDWIENDLSYCDYKNNKLIVFASLGGTCRCVMAKGILSQMLSVKKISGVSVEAAAIADPHHPRVSPSALHALRKLRASDWLKDHRPRKLSEYHQKRADLIVVLADPQLIRKSSAPTKVITAQDLFGKEIVNPYPDNEDDASRQLYVERCEELRAAIRDNFEEILRLASATPTY
jgi:protein-tyrosine-phosphatase